MSTVTLRSTRAAKPAAEATQVTQDPNDQQQVTAGVGIDPTGEVVVVTPDDFDAAAGVASAHALPDERPQTAVVNVGKAAPPARRSAIGEGLETLSGGVISGEFDESDLRTPRLSLVNGNGEMSRDYTQGALVFGDEELLPTPNLKMADATHTFRFTPLTLTKGYREKLSDEQYKAGLKPRYARSIDEVESMGGTTRWIADVGPSWQPTVRVLMLVEAPEIAKNHPLFVIQIGEKLYALGEFFSAGMSYRSFATPLVSAAQTALHVPRIGADGQPVRNERGAIMRDILLHKVWWKWVTEKSGGDHPQFVPKITMSREETSPEVREFIKGLGLGSVVTQ